MPILELDYMACPTNILDLEEPEKWSCWLERYGHMQGKMGTWITFGLSILSEKGTYRTVMFNSVRFIEVPMGWESANFCVAQYEDCVDMMHKTGLLAEVPDDELDRWLDFIMPWTHLFTVETSTGFVVRLIADAVSYEKDD